MEAMRVDPKDRYNVRRPDARRRRSKKRTPRGGKEGELEDHFIFKRENRKSNGIIRRGIGGLSGSKVGD